MRLPAVRGSVFEAVVAERPRPRLVPQRVHAGAPAIPAQVGPQVIHGQPSARGPGRLPYKQGPFVALPIRVITLTRTSLSDGGSD